MYRYIHQIDRLYACTKHVMQLCFTVINIFNNLHLNLLKVAQSEILYWLHNVNVQTARCCA